MNRFYRIKDGIHFEDKTITLFWNSSLDELKTFASRIYEDDKRLSLSFGAVQILDGLEAIVGTSGNKNDEMKFRKLVFEERNSNKMREYLEHFTSLFGKPDEFNETYIIARWEDEKYFIKFDYRDHHGGNWWEINIGCFYE